MLSGPLAGAHLIRARCCLIQMTKKRTLYCIASILLCSLRMVYIARLQKALQSSLTTDAELAERILMPQCCNPIEHSRDVLVTRR